MTPSSPAPPPSAGMRRSHAGWLAGGTFALGLVCGGVLVSGPDDDLALIAVDAAAPPADTNPDPADVPSDAEARFTDACLRAVAAAEEASTVLDELGGALVDLDAGRLDRIVHELVPLQVRLDEEAAACRLDVRRPADAGAPGD
ncbi:hypothetical protein [Blastococcus sp. TBT05-19]|uniref:hypothetical protein n=1 Tax=Blastococcus sp. TBT05-19 TaxID=2250581 RepID=UPI001F3F16FF|nr:hypothetical protein [Blastococcus sp. TBT05-19]